MTQYSRQTFAKGAFQWTKCVVHHLYSVYSACSDHIIALLVEVFDFIYNSTHTHPFNGRRTTRVSRYQKGKTNLDFTEAEDSEWQWHHLGHMQVCISLQTDNHASIPPLCFLQARCPSCRPTNSVKALKAQIPNGSVTDVCNLSLIHI